MKLADALAPLVDLLYPPRCPSCGEGLAAQDGLCSACWGKLDFPADPACPGCLRPVAGHGPPQFCEACCADPPLYDGIAAGTLYTGASRRLVLSLKNGKIGLAPMLARMIAARLPPLDGEWLFVPVPLHRLRLWKRGYNQSALLARELARIHGQRLLVEGLVRSKATPPLGHLNKAERAQALAGVIAPHPRHAATLKRAQVVLVDDVMTSGATSNACVTALRVAGAQTVLVACFARVQHDLR